MPRRDPGWEFKRAELRRSTRRRRLDCGCTIDHGESYSYFVGKPRPLYEGDPPALLQQTLTCQRHP